MIIVIFILAILVLAYIWTNGRNRQTCFMAYASGFDDVGTMTWRELQEAHSNYLKPFLRPMDAVAYERGVRFFLNHCGQEITAEAIKFDFTEAWENDIFLKEGTKMVRFGTGNFVERLLAMLPEQVRPMVVANPNMMPFECAMRLEKQTS
jgi:hypothetical protein